MKKLLKIVLLTLFFLIFLFILLKIFVPLYYKDKITNYTSYVDYDVIGNGNELRGKNYNYEPSIPVGGCSNYCYGEKTYFNCERYNNEAAHCEVECRGYSYFTCGGPSIKNLIMAFLIN